jgi:hypothetical protein
VFYTGEPKRLLAYENAGRPKSWLNSMLDGSVTYDGVKVWGMDPSHFHTGPLGVVVDKAHSEWLDTPLGPMTYSQVARVAYRFLIAQLAGMFRTNGTYIMPDRPVACMLRAVSGAMKRNIIEANADDAAVLSKYLDLILDCWLGPRVWDENNLQQSGAVGVVENPGYYWQIANGPYWTLPTLWFALPYMPVKQRVYALEVCARLSRLVRRMRDIGALGCYGISFPTEQCDVVHINYEWLTTKNVHYSPDDYTKWAVCPLFVAGEVLADASLVNDANTLSLMFNDPQWCVTASGAAWVGVGQK